MKPGILVKTKGARIGVPAGTVGLIVAVRAPSDPHILTANGNKVLYYDVEICGKYSRIIRRMARDLEIINASR